jgi:hypothetical protein
VVEGSKDGVEGLKVFGNLLKLLLTFHVDSPTRDVRKVMADTSRDDP